MCFCAGWFFGDPHLQTLDGNDYTFNGYGEYQMIAADHAMTHTSVVVQARTTPLSGTTATVLTAAAMGIYNGSTQGMSDGRVMKYNVHQCNNFVKIHNPYCM